MINHVAPDIVLYHKGCRDGFTAAWAISNRHPNAQYIPVAYGEKIDFSPYEDKDIIMVDVSLEREEMLKLHATARSLLLVDHHKTAFEKLSDLPFAFFDMTRSGAGLAWDLFNSAPRPLMIEAVEDRDLWKWTVPNSKDITTVLDTVPEDFSLYSKFCKELEENPEKIIEQGKAMAIYHMNVAQLLLKDAHPIVHGTQQGMAVNVPHAFVSDVGNLLVQEDKVEFAFLWSQLKDGSVRASWRGKNTPIDHLARDFGGGGHPLASGAQMDMDTLLSYLSGSMSTTPKPLSKNSL